MSSNIITRFSKLFQEVEIEIGTRDLTLLVLRVLKDVLHVYKGKTLGGYFNQMENLAEIVTQTQPKFAIVIDHFYKMLDTVQKLVDKYGASSPFEGAVKKEIEEALELQLQSAVAELQMLINFSRTINLNNKTILLMDHSHTVHDVLKALWEDGQRFKVILAEQDPEKTLSNIEILTAHKIEFTVVPAYMLSNLEDEIDVCLFGALTLKNTAEFVMSTGTSAVISQCHSHGIKTYIFMTASKFALWEAKKRDGIHRHAHTRKHPAKEIEFNRLKFSHDRVPLCDIDTIVTDKGVLNCEQVMELYSARFAKRQKQQKKLLKSSK